MAAPTVVNAASGTFAAATSAAVTLPASLTLGNLLLLFINTRATSNTFTAPVNEGWVAIGTTASSAIFYKIVDGAEGATSTFTWGASATSAACVLQISGNSVAPVEVLSGLENTASTSCTAPTVTAKNTADLLVSFYSSTTANAITVPGSQTGIGGTTGNSRAIIAGYETLSAGGATGTRVATITSATNVGWNIGIREPATAPVVQVLNALTNPRRLVNQIPGLGAGPLVSSFGGNPYFGRYKIAGHCKTGTNQPLERYVRLLTPLGHRVLRGTYSKASDGSFCFNNIASGEYLVEAIDQTGVDNAVIAARVAAVAM